MKHLLCKLGLHRWLVYDDAYVRGYHNRRCLRCGLVQFQDLLHRHWFTPQRTKDEE